MFDSVCGTVFKTLRSNMICGTC